MASERQELVEQITDKLLLYERATDGRIVAILSNPPCAGDTDFTKEVEELADFILERERAARLEELDYWFAEYFGNDQWFNTKPISTQRIARRRLELQVALTPKNTVQNSSSDSYSHETLLAPQIAAARALGQQQGYIAGFNRGYGHTDIGKLYHELAAWQTSLISTSTESIEQDFTPDDVGLCTNCGFAAWRHAKPTHPCKNWSPNGDAPQDSTAKDAA